MPPPDPPADGASAAGRGPRTGWAEALRFWGPAAGYMLLIFALSAIPSPPSPPAPFSDKAVHFVEYFGLGILLVRALGRERWTRPTAAIVVSAAVLAVLYGLSDEGHQYFVAGRECDWRDALADAAGAGLAASGLYAWGIITAVFRKH